MPSSTNLTGPVYHDTVYTHDYSDSATWFQPTGLGASAWVLQPPSGFAYKIVGCETKASAELAMHAPLHLWFQAKRSTGAWGPLPSTGMNGAAYLVTYNSMKDWVRRAGALPQVGTLTGNPEVGKPLLLFNFNFNPAPVLWSSIGTDDSGTPKWNRLIIQVANHQPYKNTLGQAVELAVAKYQIEIYKEVPK